MQKKKQEKKRAETGGERDFKLCNFSVPPHSRFNDKCEWIFLPLLSVHVATVSLHSQILFILVNVYFAKNSLFGCTSRVVNTATPSSLALQPSPKWCRARR